DVAAADHGEGVGGREERRTDPGGDGLLAGVDKVGVDLGVGGEGADAEQAVLRLEPDVHPFGDVVGDQGRHADAQVDDVTVAEFAGGALGDLFAGEGHGGQVYGAGPGGWEGARPRIDASGDRGGEFGEGCDFEIGGRGGRRGGAGARQAA